jgi:hypothetical protein
MKTMSAREAKNAFGLMIDTARAEPAERVNDFASPCFMNLLWKPGCSSRRFSPLRVG